MATDAQRGVTIAGAPVPPRWFETPGRRRERRVRKPERFAPASTRPATRGPFTRLLLQQPPRRQTETK